MKFKVIVKTILLNKKLQNDLKFIFFIILCFKSLDKHLEYGY